MRYPKSPTKTEHLQAASKKRQAMKARAKKNAKEKDIKVYEAEMRERAKRLLDHQKRKTIRQPGKDEFNDKYFKLYGKYPDKI